MNLLEKNTCKLRIKGSNQPIITDHTIPKVDRIELYMQWKQNVLQ